MVLLCFGCPLWFFIFFGSRNGIETKIKGKLLENQSQPTPGPLRSFLLGLSRLCLLWGSFSGTSLESLLAGLLWAPLAGSAPSFLSLSSFTRNKEEIRLWGLSGASVWALCIFSFTRYGETKNTVWAAQDLLWASPFSISPTQPAHQYTYDLTEFPLTERNFSEEERLNPTRARNRYDGMRSGNERSQNRFQKSLKNLWWEHTFCISYCKKQCV